MLTPLCHLVSKMDPQPEPHEILPPRVEPDVLEDLKEFIELAEKPMEEAPFHRGELPPENNRFGSYYIPRRLGPEDKPLPEMPWDNTGPSQEAKEPIARIITILRRSGIYCLFFERMPKDQALSGIYNKVFHFGTDDPWDLLYDFRSLKQGDIVEFAAHDMTLLYRTHPWGNIYENPLEREKYHKLKREEESRCEELLNKKASKNKRLERLETFCAKYQAMEKLWQKQSQAISTMMMINTKHKFNNQMVEYMRENVASLELHRLEMREKMDRMEKEFCIMKELLNRYIKEQKP